MADILTFKKASPPATSRQAFIESLWPSAPKAPTTRSTSC